MNPLILFFFFFFPVFGLSSPKRCEPFICGKLGEIKFPFYRSNNSELGNNNYCDYGLYKVNCVNESRPLIQLKKDGHWYEVESISQAISITIITENSNHLRRTSNCEEIERFALPFPSPVSNLTTSATSASSSVTKCNRKVGSQRGVDYGKKSCGDYDERNARKEGRGCSVLWIPRERRFSFEIVVNPLCYRCRRQQGKCDSNADNNDFVCSKHNIIINQGKNRGLKLKLGLGIPLVILTLLLTLLMIGFFVRRYKDILLRRNTSDTNMNSDEESKCVYYGIPLFSYKELQEATNNFDAGKELGDGGFGTVYHGVLKDGREVAVKRLYEQNYRRVEQFTNEVEMLTRLRHPNLVTLYGCTSHLSRDLLLVYEYIPNGTLADHLQLDTSWPLRLSVAVETATALAYLHASGIVHRDVKSANILLDAAFAVKVADFGLSRLFPSHVTHVSTAPQGTPGYVDPEYHECYQLTAKSDVYSFGVVLAELLSSMPAVDITRRHHEINLSNFARVKIQSRAFEDLFDPRLNFGQDPQFSSAAVAVAELAFRCLRQDKETRPTMDEVLAELKQIDNISNDDVVMETVKIDESYLLRTQIEKKEEEEPASPNTVTHNWPTNYSIVTPNFSIDKVS